MHPVELWFFSIQRIGNMFRRTLVFQCSIGAQPFWNIHDEITYCHGIVFKGSKVIVLAAMRPAMLKLVHLYSHLDGGRQMQTPSK